jgi:hypothetical protein
MTETTDGSRSLAKEYEERYRKMKRFVSVCVRGREV